MFFQVVMLCGSLGIGSKIYKNIKKKYEKKNLPETAKKETHYAVEKTVPEKSCTDEEKEKANQYLALSSASLGLAALGIFFRPLSLLSAAGVVFTSIPLFNKAKDAAFNEKKARIEILDSIAIIAGLACGYYFVSALSAFIYFGAQKLRLATENRSRNSLVNIFENRPVYVWVLKDGVEIRTEFDLLQSGDTVVVNAGESVPADGVIIKGLAMIEEHMLTGEAQPVEKEAGDRVFAATLLISGRIYIEVEKAGKETVASQIGEILKNTSDFTSDVELKGQEIADASVIPTFTLSALAYPAVGIPGAAALLFSDFLDNMRVIAPLSMLNFLHTASREGILIKDGRSLQQLPEIDTVIFDKTGTLTLAQPGIRKIYSFGKMDENRILRLAAAAEYRQTHPIAKAILEEACDRNIEIPQIDTAGYKIGYGISVKIGKKLIMVGSDRFMNLENIAVPAAFDNVIKQTHEQGRTLVYLAADHCIEGAIELETNIRPETKEVIKQLKQRNMTLGIISGDHEKPTRIMAEQLGMDICYAEVMPENKADLIGQIQAQGKKVCFIGDGINDSIALKKADVSISMSGASTAATDSAQIVMLDNSLEKIPELFDIAFRFQKNMNDIFYTISWPGVIGIGGVFFAHVKIPVMLFLYSVSMFSGGMTAMISGIREKKRIDGKNSE